MVRGPTAPSARHKYPADENEDKSEPSGLERSATKTDQRKEQKAAEVCQQHFTAAVLAEGITDSETDPFQSRPWRPWQRRPILIS